jgi:hypothetical protein
MLAGNVTSFAIWLRPFKGNLVNSEGRFFEPNLMDFPA